MSYSILPSGDIPRRLSHPRLGNSKSHVSNSFLLSGLIENLAAADKFNIIKSTSLFPFPILQIAKPFSYLQNGIFKFALKGSLRDEAFLFL